MIYPIPPGYYCVPSALIALTGEPADAVILPAIARHSRAASLLEAPAGVAWRVTLDVLDELGYTARPYRKEAVSGALRARVATFAKRSEKWGDRTVLITTAGRPGHALVVSNGRVYDNHVPVGVPGDRHPFATALVDGAWLIERRT